MKEDLQIISKNIYYYGWWL